MESLSRPSHRRKHSATTNGSSSSYSSLSFRSPYDDVLLSKGGKAKFEAHEYDEIFAGSSSIPVLDLSGLGERVGSSESKLDYSNIFGGLKEDDVAVPYEQLISGALRKTKTRRIPADVEPPFHDPGSINSSGMTKRSSGTSDQSNDGLKQQFNMAFSRTDQRNSHESNGKTHIAKLHAVPGFTHFVEETPLQKKEYERHERPMKREVSRTWSFSAGAESITVKSVIASEKPHIPDKSCSVNGINLKSHIPKIPPSSNHPSKSNDSKDIRQSNLQSFASKEDSEKTEGEYSPPFLDEELDENSVWAVSAAALKKAIDQAQESIRIAKMIMEKKKGLNDGTKPRSKRHSKVKDKKETKENNVVAEVYRKFVPSLSHNDSCLNARKAKVETVRENIEAAIDHRDTFTEVGQKFAPSCSESEMLTEEEFFEVENVEQNVEASEAHGKTTNFTPESWKASKETLEQSELSVDQSRGPEVVSEMEESAPNSSESMVEALEQCQVTVDCVEGHESEQEQEKIMHEGGGKLRIDLTLSNCVADEKEECQKDFVEYERLVSMEKLAGLKFEFDSSQNGLILAEKKQPDLDRKPENVSEWNESNQDGKSSDEIYQEVGTKANIVPEIEIVSEQKLPGEDVQNEIADTDRDSCEYEAEENMKMETDNCSDNEKSEISWDVDDTHIGSRRSEENQDKFIESQSNSSLEGLSSDNECVNVDLMDADQEITLPKAEAMFETNSEIDAAAEECANMVNLPEFHTNDDKVTEVGSTVLERTSEIHEEPLLTSVPENIDEVPTQESEACRENLKDENEKDNSGDMPSQSHCEAKEMEKSMEAEKNEENPGISSKGNDEKSEINEYLQRIEAIKRGREREKEKKAAERAIREARERAFAEARERAAVERLAAEARQKGVAEARDKHEKASVENKKPADKVSNGAKLRAERAAVERATNEARERALEKARTQTQRVSSNGVKHSFSSSDLEKCDGASSDSSQRNNKARLEKHQTIMERAAKALAEKNMRDVLAQKEQAEKNRFAESLDADIKRWATGKEGNLRALLSTLQYILGPESGWQPVSLTDIITSAAVKKGYRKATLCVHPDKLQQRGATIQQKYICEKVFDLLKAAWNRFNSEEK